MSRIQAVHTVAGVSWHRRRYMEGTMANIGFLLDMDGVIYRGSELIPGAYDFVNRSLRLPAGSRRGSHRYDPR
jgi:hypothetical protein